MYRRILATIFCALLLGGVMPCPAGCSESLPEKTPSKAGIVRFMKPLWTDQLNIQSQQTGNLSRVYHIEKIDPAIRYFTFNQAFADINVLSKAGVEVSRDENPLLPMHTVKFEDSVEIEITFSEATLMANGDIRTVSLFFYDGQGEEITHAQFGITKIGGQYLFI